MLPFRLTKIVETIISYIQQNKYRSCFEKQANCFTKREDEISCQKLYIDLLDKALFQATIARFAIHNVLYIIFQCYFSFWILPAILSENVEIITVLGWDVMDFWLRICFYKEVMLYE